MQKCLSTHRKKKYQIKNALKIVFLYFSNMYSMAYLNTLSTLIDQYPEHTCS